MQRAEGLDKAMAREPCGKKQFSAREAVRRPERSHGPWSAGRASRAPADAVQAPRRLPDAEKYWRLETLARGLYLF